MRNRISLYVLIFVLSLLLLYSLPSVQAIYAFSLGQEEDIRHKMYTFGRWFHHVYHIIAKAKEIEYSAPSSSTALSQNAAKFTDYKWQDIKLPNLPIGYQNYNMQEFIAKFESYNDELRTGQVKNENDAIKILDKITEKLNEFRVEMNDSWEAKLREEWIQKEKAAIAKIKNERKSSPVARHAEDEKGKGIVQNPESSSSRNNAANEKEIDINFLPLLINENIYELNEQIWFGNYNNFFECLKNEIEKDQVDIWNFYLDTLEIKRNKIMQKELNKKILGILPKAWTKDAVKAFNKKIAGIVQKVRNRMDKKKLNEMKKSVEKFLEEESTKMDGINFRERTREKAELLDRIRVFRDNLLKWQKGEYAFVNKMELAKLEADFAKEQILANEKNHPEEEKKVWNMSMAKDIPNEAFGNKLIALGNLIKFARNIVNEIEAEIGKKYETETIKLEIKRIYYTVLTNRATLEMLKYMADEFGFILTENGGTTQRTEATAAHQQSLNEHSEIAKTEKRNTFLIENLTTITILATDLLKFYLGKLDERATSRKFIEEKLKMELKSKGKRLKGEEPTPEKMLKIAEENKDNVLVESIKSLWKPTKYNNYFNHLNEVQASRKYKILFPNYNPNRNYSEKFHLFEFGMGQNELPENFLDRYKIDELGLKTEVRIIVDSMNLLAIFSRMKHLMDKTGMDKSVDHFKAGKIGLAIQQKLKDKIEYIEGQRIPQTFAAYIYEKYSESLQPKPNKGSSRGDGQHSETPGSEHSNSRQPTQTHSILQRTPTSSPHRSPRGTDTSASPHQSPTSVFHTPHWHSPSVMGQNAEEEEEDEEEDDDDDDDKQKETSIFERSWGTTIH